MLSDDKKFKTLNVVSYGTRMVVIEQKKTIGEFK